MIKNHSALNIGLASSKQHCRFKWTSVAPAGAFNEPSLPITRQIDILSDEFLEQGFWGQKVILTAALSLCSPPVYLLSVGARLLPSQYLNVLQSVHGAS